MALAAWIGVGCFHALHMMMGLAIAVKDDDRIAAAVQAWLVCWGVVLALGSLASLFVDSSEARLRATAQHYLRSVLLLCGLMVFVQAAFGLLFGLGLSPASSTSAMINRSEAPLCLCAGALLIGLGGWRLRRVPTTARDWLVLFGRCAFIALVSNVGRLMVEAQLVEPGPDEPISIAWGLNRLGFALSPIFAHQLGVLSMPKLSLVEPSRPDLTPPASLSLDTKAARRALRAIDVAPEQFDALDDMELVSTFHEALGVGLRMLADCSLARAEIEGERGDWMWVIGVRVQDQLVNYRIPLGEEDPFSLFTLSQLISKIEAHVHA